MLRAIIKTVLTKTKTKNKKVMAKQTKANSFQRLRSSKRAVRGLFVAVAACAVLVLAVPGVRADTVGQLQQKIDELSGQNTQKQKTVDKLQIKASDYQDAINKLQDQIGAVQGAIGASEAQQAKLKAQIAVYQQQIDYEKKVLGEDIKSMYVGDQMSTIEMLATSKNLSDYLDQQQYKQSVQDQLQTTLTQISNLQNRLEQQQNQVEDLIKQQQSEEAQLASDQAQKNQLLSMNQSQQSAYNKQIKDNNSEISKLQAEQIEANRQLVSTGHVDYSGSCGGGYPASASGPGGNWGCDYPLDNTVDNWGMYNRECVSYTAWMVYETYGYMPYWGGSGNANQWPGDAQAAGIPTGSTPKVNSVAIYMGGSSDPWGHAMWVKSVNGDGTITVDQYNLYYDGNFYETTIPASGLTYIYFGDR